VDPGERLLLSVEPVVSSALLPPLSLLPLADALPGEHLPVQPHPSMRPLPDGPGGVARAQHGLGTALPRARPLPHARSPSARSNVLNLV
jgi:hypothetical protein